MIKGGQTIANSAILDENEHKWNFDFQIQTSWRK